MNLVKTALSKIDFYVFCASIFTLSQSIKWSSKLLFIALVLGVVKSIYQNEFSWLKKHRLAIILYSVFLGYICVQGMYLDGFNGVLNAFEKDYAPYLVFLLMPFLYRDKEQVKVLPKVFITGLFFTFFLIVCMSLIELELYNRLKVLKVFDIHHLYISLYILFAINYLLANWSKNLATKTKAVYAVMIVILTGFLVFFTSKAAIVIFIILLTYHVLNKMKITKILMLFLGLSLLALLIIFNNYFLELYLKALDFRLRIWDAAINVISQNVVFGHGASHEYFQLNNTHFLQGDYDFLDSNYNAHNQYLSFLIRFGIIGLLLVLTTYILPLFKINKSFKKEYIGFILIVAGMAFIESMFNRHHGIVFCTAMLYYYNTMSKNDI